MSKKIIWTSKSRVALFDGLVERFGPYAKWEGRGPSDSNPSGHPGEGKLAEFDAWCDGFAKAVGANSGAAVRMQIGFAIPDGIVSKTYPEWQYPTKIIGAALLCGFITAEDAVKSLTNQPTEYAEGRRITSPAFAAPLRAALSVLNKGRFDGGDCYEESPCTDLQRQ